LLNFQNELSFLSLFIPNTSNNKTAIRYLPSLVYNIRNIVDRISNLNNTNSFLPTAAKTIPILTTKNDNNIQYAVLNI